MNIKDIKKMPDDAFLPEQSSRRVGSTVSSLWIDEDGSFSLPGWSGWTMVGWSDRIINCSEDIIAVMLEQHDGTRMWMHICDHRENK